MHLMFRIGCTALRIIATGITLLNELILVSAPWITAGRTDCHWPVPFAHPIITTLAYAPLEPLYIILVAKSGIPPWIYLVGTVHYVWVCQFVVEYLSYLGRMLGLQEPETVKTTSFKPNDTVDAELQPDLEEQHRVWRPNWQAFFAVIAPLHCVAASNAAFILFAANLEASSKADNSAIVLGLHYFAIILYLASRFGDFMMTQISQKVMLWQRQSNGKLQIHLACIGILLLVKMAFRSLLGQSIFPILQILTTREILPSLATEMPTWLKAVMEWKPPWPWPWWATTALNYASIPAQLYAFYVFRRAFAE